MISEEKRIKTRAQLKEYLDVELAPYEMHGRQYIAYLLQLSEKAVLRRHIILLRKTEYHLNAGHKLRGLWYLMRHSRFECKYAVKIGLNSCAKGLRIMHLSPCGITYLADVGENCRLHIDSYLVAGDGTAAAPVVGDNAVIGTGSRLIGGVHLGNDVTVGANSVVTKSFEEDHITIAGAPAKVISRNHHVF